MQNQVYLNTQEINPDIIDPYKDNFMLSTLWMEELDYIDDFSLKIDTSEIIPWKIEDSSPLGWPKYQFPFIKEYDDLFVNQNHLKFAAIDSEKWTEENNLKNEPLLKETVTSTTDSEWINFKNPVNYHKKERLGK